MTRLSCILLRSSSACPFRRSALRKLHWRAMTRPGTLVWARPQTATPRAQPARPDPQRVSRLHDRYRCKHERAHLEEAVAQTSSRPPASPSRSGLSSGPNASSAPALAGTPVAAARPAQAQVNSGEGPSKQRERRGPWAMDARSVRSPIRRRYRLLCGDCRGLLYET